TFDTFAVHFASPQELEKVRARALQSQVNFYYEGSMLVISVDETTTEESLEKAAQIFGAKLSASSDEPLGELSRESKYLQHSVFSQYRSETAMLRYIHDLESKDLSLVHSMIPLGSCTMKLNAATEMAPLSLPEFSDLHPLAPLDQAQGSLGL